MKLRNAGLATALMMGIPALATFDTYSASMTKAQITAAMATDGNIFTDNGVTYKLVPGEGAGGSIIAGGEVLNSLGDHGSISGFNLGGDSGWLFSMECPPQFDAEGRMIPGTGMSGRIYFKVQKAVVDAPAAPSALLSSLPMVLTAPIQAGDAQTQAGVESKAESKASDKVTDQG